MKRIIFAMLVAAAAFLTITSCSKQSVQTVYQFGISSFSGDADAVGIFEKYLSDKDAIPNGTSYTLTGTSEVDTDNQALSLWQANYKKIVASEVILRMDKLSAYSLTYSCTRTDANDRTITIGSINFSK